MNVKLVRAFGFFGVAAPIVGFTIILLAIQTAPWFSWTGNALSDLGVGGFTAVVFNFGLVMTAAVVMAFSLGIYELTRGDTVGQAGFALSLASALFLIGIGVFPETVGRIHFYFSVAFFVSLPLSLLTLATYMIRNGMRSLGPFTAGAGVAAALVWAPRWGAVAVPEALSALSVCIW